MPNAPTPALRRSAAPAPVTVVVATYNRPEALVLALRSLIGQTMSDWHAIVVGDACGDGTAEAIAGLDDPRIAWVNLPERCGEQALPNSVGMALARSQRIAFLNQDDLWLPDHLELGLAGMGGTDGPAVAQIGSAMFARSVPGQPGRFAFHGRSRADRTMQTAFRRPWVYLEPLSAWIVDRRAIRRTGPMTPAAQLFRTPLEDWALRMWRTKGVRVQFNPAITVIKDNSLGPPLPGRPEYERERLALAPMLARMQAEGADAIRLTLDRMLAEGLAAGVPPRDHRRFSRVPDPEAFAAGLTREAAQQFRATGEDAFAALCRAQGLEPGWLLRGSLRRRVGEDLGTPPDLARLIAAARAQYDGDRHDH